MTNYRQPQPKPAATPLAWTVALIPIWYVLFTLAAALWIKQEPSTSPFVEQNSSNTPLILFIIGAILFIISAICATVGTWRLVSHADRNAGVTYPQTPLYRPTVQQQQPPQGS